MGCLLRAVLVASVLWTSGALAAPGDPIGPQFQVNTYTPNLQNRMEVSSDGAGGFVVVWTSGAGGFGTDHSSSSIEGQRFDATGAPIGTQFQVNTYTPRAQQFPAVAALDGGGFVVVWQSYLAPDDPSANSIQAQRFDATGMPAGGEFHVNAFTTGHQRTPVVAPTGDGFVIVWASDLADDDPSYSIQAQRFDASGSPLGAQFQVNSYTTGVQRLPSVVSHAGGFLVVWDSEGGFETDTSGLSIQARRLDAAGLALGPEIQVNTYTTGDQFVPRVGADGAGGFVVTWGSYGSAGTDSDTSGVEARLLDAAGLPLGSEFQVNTYTTSYQLSPAVGPDGSGGFVVVWASYGGAGSDDDGWSIQGQHFDPSGVARGSEFQVNSYTAGHQVEAVLAPDGAGGFVVAWSSDASSGTDTLFDSVQAQRFEGGTTTTSTTAPASTSSSSSSSTSSSSTSSTTTSSSTTSTTLLAGCASAPASGCIAPEGGKLVIAEASAGRERLKVVMKRPSVAVSQAQLGNPVSGATRYRLCLYDAAGTLAGGLLIDRAGVACGAPPQPCWRMLGTTGYRYADRDGSASGVVKLTLQGGAPSQPRLVLKGANDAVHGHNALPTGLAAALAGSASATAQLIASDASCFSLNTPPVRQADGLTFRAGRP
jgi:hypothetical protein